MPFDSLKQINADVLNVGYAEAGPANGRRVILLHGWTYDIHSYVDVAPILVTSRLGEQPQLFSEEIRAAFRSLR